MRNFKNILIVRTDRIGDVVLTTPMLTKLRQLCPHAHITVLLSPLTKDLMQGHPAVDRVIVDDRESQHKGLRGFLRLRREIKQGRYELAIILHTKKRTNALCFAAGIPYRLGYCNNKFGFLLTHPIKDIRPEGKWHEAGYCLNILRHLPCGTSFDAFDPFTEMGELYVAQAPESDIWAEQYLSRRNIQRKDIVITIHAGASDMEKRCSYVFFADLIEALIVKYKAKVLLIGASYIKESSKEILKALPSNNQQKVFDCVGDTTVSQLVSLIKRSSVLISNDSGPVHLAAALQRPVVSLFVRNQPGINPERWRPLGARSRYISVPRQTGERCNPSGQSAKDVTASKKHVWQDFITKDRILEEVDSLFKL
jgi:heptosyltransferase-2